MNTPAAMAPVSSENAQLLRVANDSGFPLQIAVRHAVNSSTKQHGWSVAQTEHAWSNTLDERSGFIDLFVRDRHELVTLVIECKRVRDTNWIFFGEEGQAKSRRHAKGWATVHRGAEVVGFDWYEVPLDPATLEAKFCAVRGQGTNDKNTLLERLAGELVSSTEALAAEERDYHNGNNDRYRFYFNVIVTTAQLKFASFKLEDLSLATGEIANASFQSVPYLRLRKHLSMRPSPPTPADLNSGEKLGYRRESTVFIVNAEHIVSFLDEFEVPDDSLRQFNYILR